MNGHLILVKHSLPEIKVDLPAHNWMLLEEGRLRAGRLAEKLSMYRPQVLASSPEPKALETAEIVGRRLQLPVQVMEDLHEHDRSTAGYLSKEEFKKAVLAFFEDPDTQTFGSETANQAYERFSRAVAAVLTGNEKRSTVIVSHGTVIALFVSRVTGQSAFEIWNQLGLPGFVVLDMQSNKLIALENILGEATYGTH